MSHLTRARLQFQMVIYYYKRLGNGILRGENGCGNLKRNFWFCPFKVRVRKQLKVQRNVRSQPNSNNENLYTFLNFNAKMQQTQHSETFQEDIMQSPKGQGHFCFISLFFIDFFLINQSVQGIYTIAHLPSPSNKPCMSTRIIVSFSDS